MHSDCFYDQKDGTVKEIKSLSSNKWVWLSGKYDSSSKNGTIYKNLLFQKKKRSLYSNEKIHIFKIRKWDNFNANVDVGTGDNTVSVDVS